MKYTLSLNKIIVWRFSGAALERIENVMEVTPAALDALRVHSTVMFRMRFEMAWNTIFDVPLHLRHLFADCCHVGKYEEYDNEITKSFLVNEVFDKLTLETLQAASCDEEGTYAFVIDLSPYVSRLYHV